MRDHFWNRWRCEYLTDLREYHKAKNKCQLRTVSVGDVVIVHKENMRRGLWKIGKVEEIIWGRDGVISVIRVITKGKPVLLNRPVPKLYPLEVRAGTLYLSLDPKQNDNKAGGRSTKERQW